jgi:hypothetical protein
MTASRGAIVCRRVAYCPICDRRRRFVQKFIGTWSGDRWTCLGCGDSWQEGELMPRPFRPRWRAEAKAKARARWQQAMTRAEFQALIRRQLAAEREYERSFR